MMLDELLFYISFVDGGFCGVRLFCRTVHDIFKCGKPYRKPVSGNFDKF